MIEIVYKNRDNPNTIAFKEDGVAIDFSAATRMVLSFCSSSVVADSDVDSALIDWSVGGGVVEFNINDLPLSGYKAATLIVYDAVHTDGQVLVHMDSRELTLSFVDA